LENKVLSFEELGKVEVKNHDKTKMHKRYEFGKPIEGKIIIE